VAEAAFDLRDRIVAGLDDHRPTAIEESAAAWRVFFESTGDRDRAAAWLRALGDPRMTFEPIEVDDEDWARRSQADLGPVRVGRIVVTPPWCVEAAGRESGKDIVTIVVVPSTGFGTGHHASTRLCLALLQQIPLGGRSLLDAGTGSGVLALAAARLGANPVTAVDNDADAVCAARENVALNPGPVPVHLLTRDFRELGLQRADVVVANLTGELLRQAAASLVSLANPGAHLIVSGILSEGREDVLAALEAAGAVHVRTLNEDEWVGMLLRVK
jgi:ribosomal protein L11 methyltransferase